MNKENINGLLWSDSIEELENIKQELVQDDYEPIKYGNPINLYPFRIVSGLTTISKEGERTGFVDLNKLEQFLSVITGFEPLTIVWENSTFISNNFNDEDKKEKQDKVIQNNLLLQKKTQQGVVIKCYLQKYDYDKTTNDSAINIMGVDFNTVLVNNTLSLWVDNENQWNRQFGLTNIPTNNDMIQYLYVVLDKRSQSYQLLRLKRVTPFYKLNNTNQDKDLIGCKIDFETLNLDFSTSGNNILDFVSFGSAGEGYCFPKEVWNEETKEYDIWLDENKLKSLGCDSLQIDYLSYYNLSSLQVIGRRIIKDKQDIFLKPQRLLLLENIQPKKYDTINRLPNLNVYVGTKCFLTMEGIWKSFKDAVGGNNLFGNVLSGYNIDAQKTVLVD